MGNAMADHYEDADRQRAKGIEAAMAAGEKISASDLSFISSWSIDKLARGSMNIPHQYWRHKVSGDIYTVPTDDPIIVDTQEDAVVVKVRYLPYHAGASHPHFAQTVDRFLEKFERVEQVKVWENL